MQSQRGVFRGAHGAASTGQGTNDPSRAEDEEKPVIHEG